MTDELPKTRMIPESELMAARRPRYRHLVSLMNQWIADESEYDERVLSYLEIALKREPDPRDELIRQSVSCFQKFQEYFEDCLHQQDYPCRVDMVVILAKAKEFGYA